MMNPLTQLDYRNWNKNSVGNTLHRIRNAYFYLRNSYGTDVMDEDWDTLILFDACRYDFFSQQVPYKGRLESRISKGNWSWPFMYENLAGRSLHDTVYVTANPYASRLESDVFHRIISVIDCWDPELGTVPPADVTESAIQAHKQHPDKRIIVHYMQPHAPYLGATAERLRERFSFDDWNEVGPDAHHPEDRKSVSVFDLVRSGDVSESTVKSAYRETLDIVLDAAKPLLSAADGRVVISADHGELLGERVILKGEDWGHSTVAKLEPLSKVPWFIVANETGERRQVTAAPPVTKAADRAEESDVTDQLEALGYR